MQEEEDAGGMQQSLMSQAPLPQQAEEQPLQTPQQQQQAEQAMRGQAGAMIAACSGVGGAAAATPGSGDGALALSVDEANW